MLQITKRGGAELGFEPRQSDSKPGVPSMASHVVMSCLLYTDRQSCGGWGRALAEGDTVEP